MPYAGSKTIGILALQGGFSLHARCVQRVGAKAVLIRTPQEFHGIDGLIVPGGESTTMHLLMEQNGLFSLIQQALLQQDLPYFGTCAGLILAAKHIQNDCEDYHNDRGFGYVDMLVKRNAYGRQNDSFEAKLSVPTLATTIQATFIRAPQVLTYDDSVKVLARYEDFPVLLQYKRSLFATFHPELSNTTAIHRYWINQL